MSGKYAAEWADALADVLEAGAPIVFKGTTSTLDEATGRSTAPQTVIVAGQALQKRGDPEQYALLGLSPSQAVLLLFIPNIYGAMPALGLSADWAGQTYSVKDVDPIKLDGVALGAFIVVSV